MFWNGVNEPVNQQWWWDGMRRPEWQSVTVTMPPSDQIADQVAALIAKTSTCPCCSYREYEVPAMRPEDV